MKVTRLEFIEKMKELKGSRFAGITTVTPVGNKFGRETGNPNPGITKKTEAGVILNFRYENSVNNKLKKEGKPADFESKPRAWGKHVNNGHLTPLIEHKGKYYLECNVQSNKVKYLVNGEEVNYKDIAEFLPNKKKSGEIVKIRDFGVDKISKLRYNGVELELV